MRLRVEGLGFRVWGIRVQIRVEGLRLKVQGKGFALEQSTAFAALSYGSKDPNDRVLGPKYHQYYRVLRT